MLSEKITMPKLGLTMTEGTVSEWRVGPGEKVKKGDIILVVATDKLTYEVEASRDGVILKICVKAGETVPVGAVLAFIGDEEERLSVGETGLENVTEEPSAIYASPRAKEVVRKSGAAEEVTSASDSLVARKIAELRKTAGKVRATPLARKLAREGKVKIEEIPGSGPEGRTTAADVKQYLEAAKREKVKTSPTALKMAEDLGIDLESIQTSGRIMKEDVLKAAGSTAREEPGKTGTLPKEEKKEKRVPLTQMRKVIAERMSYSASNIPHVFFNTEADFSEFIRIRDNLNESLVGKGVKLSFNDILMKVCARALAEMPMANASYDTEASEYILHEDVNIGLAVSVEGGLLVPNVKGVQNKTLEEISRESADLVDKARKGRLQPEDMQGGTFTITNLGMFGIHDFIPIINPPEACILAVNAVIEKPVVVKGEVTVRPMSMIGLSADHRILNGADAARFLARIRELVENPCKLLL